MLWLTVTWSSGAGRVSVLTQADAARLISAISFMLNQQLAECCQNGCPNHLGTTPGHTNTQSYQPPASKTGGGPITKGSRGCNADYLKN